MSYTPQRTVGTDWMCDLLAAREYFVSGHGSLSTYLELPNEVTVVLRHFRLYTSEYPEIMLLTLEGSANARIPNPELIRATPAFAKIQTLFPQIQILSFSSSSKYFRLNDSDNLNDKQLQDWFASIDLRYVTSVGGNKPVNVSSNDKFADWTPRHLTGQCVINDIDAFLYPEKNTNGVLLELKRPKANIRTWGPYRNDRRNYESSAAIAQKHDLENRTIAYNIDRQDIVRLHKNIIWNSNNGSLDSEFALLAPTVAIQTPLDKSVVMNRHISKNGN